MWDTLESRCVCVVFGSSNSQCCWGRQLTVASASFFVMSVVSLDQALAWSLEGSQELGLSAAAEGAGPAGAHASGGTVGT